MPPQRVIPHYSELIEFNYAVAGHDGTMCDTDGELFIKPCTQAEIDFYQSMQHPHHSRMADIVPLFMGSLALNDATNITSVNEQLPVVADHVSPAVKEHVMELIVEKQREVEAATSPAPAPTSLPTENITWIPNANRKITTDMAVALENAAFGFKRPNIVDVKLGRRLWADDAPLEKKRRFDKISAETTHQDLGFRIAGMRVYKGSDDPGELDEEDYRIYDKDYGRKQVNKDNVIEAFRVFIYNARAGIDDDYGRAIADAFRQELERVRDILESEESRMYSSSLLFIFEGNGEALKAAVAEADASTAASADAKVDFKSQCETPGRSTKRIDSGIGMDEDDDEEEEQEPRIYNLKLIDFAHAAWTPGQGPDENILLGVRSLINIFEELAK